MKIMADIVRQAVAGPVRHLARLLHVDSFDPLETDLELDQAPAKPTTNATTPAGLDQNANKDTSKAFRFTESERIKRKVTNRAVKKIPGPPSVPLIGALWQYLPGGKHSWLLIGLLISDII